jgi:hypothetical protein
MTTREIKRRERRLEILAEGETNVHERLLELRGDLDTLLRSLDRMTVGGPPRMHAGRSGLSNLVPFRRGGRFLA